MRELPTPPGPSEERLREINHAPRLEPQAEIRWTSAERWSISAVARELGLHRNTGRSFLQLGLTWERHPRGKPSSLLDPFKLCLKARIAQHPLSSVRLIDEIQCQGYAGGYDLVTRLVRPLTRQRELVTCTPYVPAPRVGVRGRGSLGSFMLFLPPSFVPRTPAA